MEQSKENTTPKEEITKQTENSLSPSTNLPSQKFVLTMPMAVVIAGLLIGFGIYLSGSSESPTNTASDDKAQQQASLELINPVTKDDHIRGNPNAKVFIVEYSDLECPFCKVFHNTMQEVMKDYGDNGDVAWVFRHFPIDSLHSRARNEAYASECANEQGGNISFWKYIDRLNEITESNDKLDPKQLPEIAKFIGLDVNAFNTCLASGKYADRIAS